MRRLAMSELEFDFMAVLFTLADGLDTFIHHKVLPLESSLIHSQLGFRGRFLTAGFYVVSC